MCVQLSKDTAHEHSGDLPALMHDTWFDNNHLQMRLVFALSQPWVVCRLAVPTTIV